MQKVNALELRQSLSKIVSRLQKTGEPILLEKGRKPAAVLISLEDFKTRFVEKDADQARRKVEARIRGLARKSTVPQTAEEILNGLRSGKSK